MRWTLTAVLVAALVSAGCGEYETAQPRKRSAAPEAVGVVVDPFSPAPPARASAPSASAPQQPVLGSAQPGVGAAPAPQTLLGPPPAAAQTGLPVTVPQTMPFAQPPAQNMVQEKAEVGMGRKGHYSQGFITTPLATFWRTQEMVAYRVQVPHALDLYKATHGHFPKTQEEFEREILTPNGIKLPELPQNHRYVYDPEKGELLVEHPG